MNRIASAIATYGGLAFLAILINSMTDYGGVYGCIVSIMGIFFSRTIIFLLLSFLNFSLSIAFDNFIRVDQYFYFYKGDLAYITTLSLVSLLAYCFVGFLDMARTNGNQRKFLIDFEFSRISRLMYWPSVVLVVGVAIFVIRSESFVLSDAYDAYELRKYPFLEYLSIVIAFMLLSEKEPKSARWLFSYVAAAFFILTMFATSYRMVGIICTLSVVMVAFNRRPLSKFFLVAAWLSAYIGLTYISYWRIGHFNVSVENILGYNMDGRLDNTFTGVIETAMVYMQISREQSLGQNLGFLIGTLLPVPNSLIPDSLLYILDAKESHAFPGGGALAGFFIYFNYLLLIPYFIYLVVAFKGSLRPGVASGMYFILAITVTRWWLYGPYVIFKFLGVMLLMLLANRILVFVEAGLKSSSFERRESL